MRTRLSRSQRRAAILEQARKLITTRGFAGTEMEDIRLACGISRGGLYHHFGNKRAVLDGLVDAEIANLAAQVRASSETPLVTVLRHGSAHLGNDAGVITALSDHNDRQDYLASLTQAMSTHLHRLLEENLQALVRERVNAAHLAELFLTICTHINRREILGEWSQAQAAAFAQTALQAFTPFLRDPDQLAPIIRAFDKGSRQ